MTDHGMSQRRACIASGIARSTLRYRPVAQDDSGVIAFIQNHVAVNPRHGFDLLYDTARYKKQPWGENSAVAGVLSTAPESAAARQETTACAHQAAVRGGWPA
jgi:hypothetical protein